MKKTIYLSAIIALTACSNDEVIDSTANDPREIKLEVVTSTLTRGTTGAPTIHSGITGNYIPSFKVWAFKNELVEKADQKPIFAFEDQTVKYDNGNYEFEGGKQYWPDNSIMLDFVAFHNEKASSITTTFETVYEPSNVAKQYFQTKVTDYAVPEKASEQEDILYARTEYLYKDYYRDDEVGKVPINFRHALSQLQFEIVNESPNYYVELYSIELINAKYKGDLTFHKSTTGHYKVSEGNTFPTEYCEWDTGADNDTISYIYTYPTEYIDYNGNSKALSKYRVITPTKLNGLTITDNPTEVPTMLVLPQKPIKRAEGETDGNSDIDPDKTAEGKDSSSDTSSSDTSSSDTSSSDTSSSDTSSSDTSSSDTGTVTTVTETNESSSAYTLPEKFKTGLWLRLSVCIYKVPDGYKLPENEDERYVSAEDIHNYLEDEDVKANCLYGNKFTNDENKTDWNARYLYLHIDPVMENDVDTGWQPGKKYVYKITLGGDVSNGLNDYGDKIFAPVALKIEVADWIIGETDTDDSNGTEETINA